MRRFLGSPGGWFVLLIVECAALFVLARGLIRLFPDHSTAVYRGIVGVAIVLAAGNYVVRRRYLS
ncbi:MAG: hypothetical protein AB1551_03225 [Actinomycetota bacterium]